MTIQSGDSAEIKKPSPQKKQKDTKADSPQLKSLTSKAVSNVVAMKNKADVEGLVSAKIITSKKTSSQKNAPQKEKKNPEKKVSVVKKTSPKASKAKPATPKSKISMEDNTSKSSLPSKKQVFPWLKSYPEHVKWDMYIPASPAWTLMDDAVKKSPDRPCINFMGKEYTYGQIGFLINLVAKGLQDQGLMKGAKVGLFMPNSVYYVIFYYGILKAGGVVVNYNPLYAESELTYQINDSETQIMVTLDLKMLYDKVHDQLTLSNLKKVIVCPLASTLPFPKNILFKLFKRKDSASVVYGSQVLAYDALIDNDGKYTPITVDSIKDVALLQYTGGTTGVPKGAMLSHQNIVANAVQAASWLPGAKYGHEKILAGLPLFHVYAMTAVMTLANRMASEIIMMFPRFDVSEAIRLIQKYKVTFFPAVPTMYNMISHHPDAKKSDLSSIVACLSGGAPLPLQVKEDFERVTGCSVVEAYGLSETSPAATAIPFGGLYKKGSIGIPFPGTEIKIFSLDNKSPEDIHEVPYGERGQIAIKGPQVMLGYWNRPDATKAAFHGDFLLTGDAGYMDEDGYTFLVDRIKDLIICSGFNVYPRNVEEAIYKHPSVNEVTVIGVPDEKRGETVKAFISLNEGMTLTEEELTAFLADKLSPIEQPKYVEFRENLPRTIIGKLSKKELRV